MTPTSTAAEPRLSPRARRLLFSAARLALLAVLIASALAHGSYPWSSTVEPDPRTKSGAPATARPGQEPAAPSDGPLLRFLGVAASAESMDYVVSKSQFQLHTLLTEQRHPKTWSLSEKIQKDTEAGLRLLFSVDEDITAKLSELAARPQAIDQLVSEIESALAERKKIYIYGCGATGRLAKQMESAFWRPFWRRVKADPAVWAKLRDRLDPSVEEQLVGEMTGGDRALISSLEGFEDLPLIGRLQLQDRGVKKGDLVVCVTEGGETSSVIGTILGALDQWKAAPAFDPGASRRRLYFLYNNPDDQLRPFERSRKVIDEPGITKINLTTGPQAITGSTRMQATTIETFVLGSALETAVEHLLRKTVSRKDLARLGFREETTAAARLRKFAGLLDEVKKSVPALARLTDMETAAYAGGRFSTYFAAGGLLTVFIDSTERSPTFRLFPLDTAKEPQRKCWIQVWTDATDGRAAWQALLGRPFRGLKSEIYRKPFEDQIDDNYLREKALASLTRAGDEQAALYDFSFADPNVRLRKPRTGDLGVMAVLGNEPEALSNPNSSFRRFAQLALGNNANLGIFLVQPAPGRVWTIPEAIGLFKADPKKQSVALVAPIVDTANDPFGVRAHVVLKMMLNAHSTAVMAKLGKVVGNTMTNVSPSNLKLVGRATYLIQLHVNDTLGNPAWVKSFGPRKPIAYGESNAVLFDAIAFLRGRPQDAGQAAEVPLSIIRILESLRQKRPLSNEEALEIYSKTGLAKFLAAAPAPITPAESTPVFIRWAGSSRS
jgi:N-acetylmuramic acid 6-phosphate (MurNAc-6-P) etherase